MSGNYVELEVADEFNKIIGISEKLVVVNFYSDSCMKCLMLSPIIEDLAENLNEVNFVKINVEDNEEIAQKYSVSSIPCLVFIKNGSEVDRIVGTHSSELIETKITNLIN